MKPEPHVDLLKTILAWMITRADCLRLQTVRTTSGLNVGVHCHVDDYRFIIGKQGRTVRALQAVFAVIGQVSGGKRFNISVSDPGGLRSEETVIPPVSWSRDKEFGKLLERVLHECGYSSTVEPKSAGNKTVLIIHLGKHMPNELQEAITVIFRAMGRMNGRYVEMDFR